MVFDKSLPAAKYGKAKAISFKRDIASWNQLKEEVIALSEAEGEGNDFVKGDNAWCVCCILFNKTTSPETREKILSNWSQALRQNARGFDHFAQHVVAYSCTLQGELEIPWPTEIEKFDFLLATSTQPRNRTDIVQLTIQEITSHIVNREYFIPNFLRNIGTYQDRDILRTINQDKVLTRSLFNAVVTNYELKKQEDKNHRYWSWDHCYSAFHSKLDNDTKALHLANYLASWGMNRGSGGLLQKDYKIHVRTIEVLSDGKYSSLDCYNQNHFAIDKIELLFKLVDELSAHYSSIPYERMGDRDSISPTDTLISKVLLGTLSCVPAYDEFLKSGLELGTLSNRRLTVRGITSLLSWIKSFDIEGHRKSLPESARELPVMKLLDIYFWSLGYNLSIIEK